MESSFTQGGLIEKEFQYFIDREMNKAFNSLLWPTQFPYRTDEGEPA